MIVAYQVPFICDLCFGNTRSNQFESVLDHCKAEETEGLTLHSFGISRGQDSSSYRDTFCSRLPLSWLSFRVIGMECAFDYCFIHRRVNRRSNSVFQNSAGFSIRQFSFFI